MQHWGGYFQQPQMKWRLSWLSADSNRMLHGQPMNPNYAIPQDVHSQGNPHTLQMLEQPDSAPKSDKSPATTDFSSVKKGVTPRKKRAQEKNSNQVPKPKKPRNAPARKDGVNKDSGAPRKKRALEINPNQVPKPNKPRKAPSQKDGVNKDRNSVLRSEGAQRSDVVIINGIELDISKLPTPVCSCTGASQQCYPWGAGGWQSACCTTNMSMYPLPKRPCSRLAGRKMSQGAFKKVLEKHVGERYNLANPIDLKAHWAKHGTNRFVTIR